MTIRDVPVCEWRSFFRMAFGATALPEQLDGLAPGEVNVEMPVTT
jgi:hypothetical protein